MVSLHHYCPFFNFRYCSFQVSTNPSFALLLKEPSGNAPERTLAGSAEEAS